MALPMSRPQKHPKTGVYWFRMRVPADLVGTVGRKEVTRSLATKDASEARRRNAELYSRHQEQWANLRQPARVLTEREAHELAASFYETWLAEHRDFPSRQTFWDTTIGATLWSRRDKDAPPLPKNLGFDPGPAYEAAFRFAGHAKLEDWCRERATEFLAQKGLPATADNRSTMARAIGAAVQRASLALEQSARGTPSATVSPFAIERLQDGQSGAQTGDRADEGATNRGSGPGEPLTGLVVAWWKEAQAAGRKASTFESYRNTFSGFVAFLGHDDAARVTRSDVVRFKDHRLATPSPKTGKRVSAKTVKDSDLTALKAVFGWAVTNGRMAENPAATVTIKLGKPQQRRPKWFSDEEAKAILSAALAHEPGRENPRTAAAKRWVPWLCAFTGARVGEIGQLRKSDVRQREGHWVIWITPEAGTVKTNEAREIVLHPQVEALGFPEFAKSSADGHLFLTPAASGDVLGPLQGLKNRLAEFAREIVPDPSVAPNHGWRHRFKTVGMEVGISTRVLDAIQGQAPRTVADTYGGVTLRTMAAEIIKFPYFKF